MSLSGSMKIIYSFLASGDLGACTNRKPLQTVWTERLSWSCSNLFDTLIPERIFEKKKILKKVSRQHQKHSKLPSMQKVNPKDDTLS